ncbi:MAG: trypsin-like peptidase domain-containing protein [Pirellulales bacterium]
MDSSAYPPRPPAEEATSQELTFTATESPAGSLDAGSPDFGPRTGATAPATVGEVARLRRLLWVFSSLLLLLLAPSIAGQIQYAITSAKEQAEVDVAKEHLHKLQLHQLSFAFRLLAKTVGPSVVNVSTEQKAGMGMGSGVIVDSAGYIVTNYHVVRGVRVARIQLSDGRHGPATVIGVDRATDVAVLKTELDNLIAAEWGDSDALDVGDMVWAIGSPYGLQKSTTFGIISAKHRRGKSSPSFSVYQEFLQTDAAVNPGNSGGPLVNIEGKVIGINTAILGTRYQGISFAIPSSLARETYENIRRDGVVIRGYLGVHPEKVENQVARRLELKWNQGVQVTAVEPNTPAHDAGLELGDVILSWDGIEFSDPTLLSRAIASTPIGSVVKVDIVRLSDAGPKRLQLSVTVAARPPMGSL